MTLPKCQPRHGRVKVRSLAWGVWLASALAGASWAQDSGDKSATPAKPEVKAVSKWFDHFVVSGGPIAYGIVVLSFVAVSLMAEHFITIRRNTVVAPQSAERLRELIDRKKYIDAIHFTAEDPTMLSYVMNAGLLEAGNGYGAMQRAMEAALEERSSRMFRKIEYLSIIGNVSPMIGLFGTVYSMIKLFGAIGESGQMPKADQVAGYISIALVATFWGLAVAVPSLAVFGWFRNRIDILAAECAVTCDRLISVFKPGGSAHGTTPAAGAAAPRRPLTTAPGAPGVSPAGAATESR